MLASWFINLIPEEVTAAQANIISAEEADVLNVAMFGQTAKQWREAHPELKGNIRDYASINELICLANMENINAVLIDEGVPQGDRLVRLNQIAINQMRVLENDDNRNLLKWHEWIEYNIEQHKKRWHFDSCSKIRQNINLRDDRSWCSRLGASWDLY